MKLIRDPQQFFETNNIFEIVKKNIVVVAPSNYNIKEDDELPDKLILPTSLKINVSTQSLELSRFALLRHQIPILIFHPVGVLPKFDKYLQSLYGSCIYTLDTYVMSTKYLYDSDKQLCGIACDKIECLFRLDIKKMSDMGASLIIPQNSPFAELYFTWYIQFYKEFSALDNLYLIKDDVCYEQLCQQLDRE